MSESPHIIVACHAWYQDMIGGAFRLASEFAEHLAYRGYRVSYVCCQPEGKTDGLNGASELHTVENGVEVHRYVPPPTSMNRLLKLRYHVQQTKQLCSRLHQNNAVTALSSHSPLQGLGAALALKNTSAFCNYTVHSPFDDELLSNAGEAPGVLQRIAGRVARWVDGRNVRLADRVQTDSQYTRNNFRGKFGGVMDSKGVVAPGWVETDVFQPAENRRQLRHRLGAAWDTPHPVLFTLRRLESRMGLDTLVDACHRLKEEGLEFRMLIGGGGSLKEQLAAMIRRLNLQEHVHLLGRLPEEQLAPSYAAADCFVLPTRALECFGLIVLEAYSCNTPVIASAAAAIPELAERQGSEWLFEPGDVSQLTDRLRSWLTGSLQPTVDLRALALEYDRGRVLARWEELILGDDVNVRPAATLAAV